MRSIFTISAVFGLLICHAFADESSRGPLRIGFSPNAPDFVQRAAERIYKAAESNAVLKALTAGGKVEYGKIGLDEEPGKLGISHLVTVGMPDDPLTKKAHRFMTKFTPVEGTSPQDAKWKMYSFGYGGFTGHVGCIESGANPFRHSSDIWDMPFETELVTITGTSEEGINAAVDSFLKDCLVNGIVAGKDAWKRDGETILDRDPLEPGKLPATGFTPPEGWTLMGRTDCTMDVRLGVLEATRKQPVQAVLEKYTKPGELDGKAEDSSMRVFLNGLDRHAHGNAALTLFFEDESAARMAARRLESNKRILASQDSEPDKNTILRPVKVTQAGEKVVLSTLP